MAKKPAATPKKPAHSKLPFGDIVWCINNLSDDLIADFDANPPTLDELFSGIERLVEMGFTVTAKWDDYFDCPMVSAICGMSGYENSGLAVSARGDGLIDAYGITLYKIFTVAKGDLTGFAEKIPQSRRG